MPLINFKTDLKSLQYGNDRPGGGSSGLPYIISPSPDELVQTTDPTSILFSDFYAANKNTLDFPIRGGNLTTDDVGRPITLAGAIDRSRINAFLNDKTRGAIFKLKQQGLQATNPNIQVPSAFTTLDVTGVDIFNRKFNKGYQSLPITRIYNANARATLTQVTLQGTGDHIVRHGLSPSVQTNYRNTYEYYVTYNNTPTSNRLSVLYQTKITPNRVFISTTTEGKNKNILDLLAASNTYGVSLLGSEIFNYSGGPDSTYGVGYTIIKRGTDTTQATEKAATLYNAFTLTYQQLLEQNTQQGSDQNIRQKIGATLHDFRTELDTATAQPGNYLTSEYNWTPDNYGSRPWYSPATKGDQGAVETRRRIIYTDVNEAKIDKVNALSPFSYNADDDDPWFAGFAGGGGDSAKDIIKFAFECLDNDTPGDAVGLIFRAYLTSFTDNHQAEYNSFKYLGRGETFRTYQGFDRSISFGFKIAAQSRSEMKPLYNKLNHLISQTYPDYSANSKLMRSSVVKLTIGDYLYRVSGFLESVNINVLTDAAWEIALDAEGIDKDMNQVPQMLEVQCTFKPIHDFLPRRATYLNPSAPYIGKEGWGTLAEIKNNHSVKRLDGSRGNVYKANLAEDEAEFARQQQMELQKAVLSSLILSPLVR